MDLLDTLAVTLERGKSTAGPPSSLFWGGGDRRIVCCQDCFCCQRPHSFIRPHTLYSITTHRPSTSQPYSNPAPSHPHFQRCLETSASQPNRAPFHESQLNADFRIGNWFYTERFSKVEDATPYGDVMANSKKEETTRP